MGKCDFCGKEVTLPYTCPLCGGQFCVGHHLPENHNCQNLKEATPPSAKSSTSKAASIDEGGKSPPLFPFREPVKEPFHTIKRGFSFSSKEVAHLTIAAILTALVALSFNWSRLFIYPVQSLLLAVIMIISFILHEIAHKFTAQHFGIWAEFRLMLFGVLLTLLSIIPFSFIKFLAPGAVMIASPTNEEENGKISISGPIINLTLGVLFLILNFLVTSLQYIFRVGLFLNGFIALFNLLPITILDGKKVFRWNKMIWAGSFCLSILLTGLGFSYLSRLVI